VDHGNVRIFATQTGSVEDCAAVHSVGNIYLDITKHNNVYQKLLAKQFNSSIINRLNLGFFHHFVKVFLVSPFKLYKNIFSMQVKEDFFFGAAGC
jgi:hypothetical protein